MPMPGYEQYGEGWLIVFNYDDGNMIGQYAKNVMPAKSVDNCGASPSDPCTDNPCQNNGQCDPNPDSNRRTCTCVLGYEGDSCESRLQPWNHSFSTF